MKIRRALKRIAHRLGLVQADLDVAQHRFDHFHHRAVEQHHLGRKADRKARSHQAAGRRMRARYWQGVGNRAHHRAGMASARAQYWLGRIKRLAAKRENLEERREELQRELAEWLRKHGVRINGNRVTGGTPRERLKAAALRAALLSASGRRHSFYSQVGYWDVSHGITGEPRGARSDCSQWVTAIYHSCGLADPNAAGYRGGFTGTLVANGRPVDRAHLQPGDLVIYGSGNGFHVEMYVGPGDKTIGHGSAPVDAGTVGMIGGARFRSYL